MKAIFFDVDDTLYDQAQPLSAAYSTIFSDKIDIGKLLRLNVKYSHEVFDAARRGEGTMEELYITRAKKCMRVLGKEISDEMAWRYHRSYVENQKKIYVSETMEKILEFCVRQNIPIGIITNGMSDHQREKVETLDLVRWFDRKHIFVSGDIEIDKPDKRIFEYAKKHMGLEDVPPEEIVYVGDSFEKDVIGSKMAGWKCIWFNRRKEESCREEIKPDYVVYTETELKNLLEKID